MTNLTQSLQEKAVREFDEKFWSFDQYAIYSKDGSGLSNLDNVKDFLATKISNAVEETDKRVREEEKTRVEGNVLSNLYKSELDIEICKQVENIIFPLTQPKEEK